MDFLLWIVVCAALVALIILLVLGVTKKLRLSGFDTTDALTGIGNKKYLRRCFEHNISGYRNYYCLLYIAFDAFNAEKNYGKEKTEELQKFSAKIISSASDEYDYFARTDNGVFACLIRYSEMKKATERIEQLISSLNKQQGTVVRGISVSFRAGIYPLGEDNENFDTVFSGAETAYNYADRTKVNYCICTNELLRGKATRDRLRQKLLSAIDDNQFDMFLQFIYNVGEKKFTSAEVLSRWNNPEEGFLLPGHYINDMRNTGVISKFDYYMLDKTCALLAEWQKTGEQNLNLSCNITRITISEEDFLEKLHNIVKKYDFDRQKLMLEITEDALIDNQAVAYRNISDCKTAGIRIAIDDFGAGNTSFNDICNYPVDLIKIDREIVTKSTNEKGSAVISSLVGLAHNLGIKILCEGVETEEQNNAVVNNGSDYVQGYFHSYVFPLAEAMEYYEKSSE